MRILAIRGSDLTSLAGDFAVELDRPPLDRAGLFAITGPTGSGKSTILDALCLALYDRMPRFPDGSAPVIGRADEPQTLRVKANDVRGVLRRGAGSGFAEVDFRGTDGKHYRARWEIRRARRRPDGRLQDQTQSLTCLDDGATLGQTKTEVQAEIRCRIGLTFEQFRRSVLLAQGDFAAFLKATAKSRSELLERITGTEIYTRLSIAAHQRNAEEKSGCTALEQQLGSVRPLEDEARAALEDEVAECHRAVASAEGRLDEARQVLAWCRRYHQAQAEVARGQAELAAAQTAWEEAVPLRELFEATRAVEDLRPWVDKVDRADAAETAATEAVRESEAAHSEITSIVTGDRAVAEASDEEATVAARAVDDRMPEIAAARSADGELARLRSELELAEKRHTDAAALAGEASAASTRLESEIAAIRSEADEHRRWLADNQVVQDLADQWPRLEQELAAAAAVATQATDAERQAEALGARVQESRTEVEGLKARLDEARQAEHSLRGELQNQLLEVDDRGLEELAAAREALDERRRALQQVVTLAEELQRRADRHDALEANIQRLQKVGAESEEKASVVEESLPGQRTALDEAERTLERVVIAGSKAVTGLRQRLEKGLPCPVCGSQEHPWADPETALHGLEREQREHAENLRKSVEEMSLELERLRTESRSAARQAAEMTREVETEASAVSELRGELASQAAEVGLTPDGDPGAEADAELRDVDDRLHRARESERQQRGLAAEIDALRSRLDRRRAVRESCETELRNADKQAEAASLELAEAKTAAGAARSRLEEIEDRLVDALEAIPGWREMLIDDPDGLRERCRSVVGSWQRHSEELAAASRRLGEAEPRLAELLATSKLRLENADALKLAAQSADQAVATAEKARRSLLAGRDADTVEKQLRSTREQTRADAEAARTQANESALRLAAVNAELEDRLRRRAVAAADASRARADFTSLLEQRGIEETRVRELLAITAEQARETAASLDQLQNAITETRVRLEERQLALDSLAQDRPEGEPSLDESRRASDVAENQLRDARRKLTEAEVALGRDDAQRERVQDLLGELEQATARWRTWAALKDLIGSADGSKFRAFAQSLTLDALIVHANFHLADLAPRYRLQRVPSSDLELQIIDRDLADEIRSIHGLSGGETFLVALALALGLASLSSIQTPVESLFIDEGFGTLDPATLDVAIAALDALQAQGRQVGVISHVPAMVERIGIRVRLEPLAAGQSRVRIVDPFTANGGV